MPPVGASRRIREAIVAGIFYPDDPGRLGADIDVALEAALARRDEPLPDGVAILSPHAAFDYSLPVQAAAWSVALERSRAAKERGEAIDRIVIVAPMRTPGEDCVYLPESEAFQTPLGDVEVDSGACADLESCSTVFRSNDLPHLESHGIELQLPFVRWLFPGALLVPLLASGGPRVAAALSRALDLTLGDTLDSSLLVVSSNLATSLVAADAARRSDDALALLSAGAKAELAARDDLVGATAMATLLGMASVSRASFRLLARLDSGSRAREGADRIVHYAAASWHEGGFECP